MHLQWKSFLLFLESYQKFSDKISELVRRSEKSTFYIHYDIISIAPNQFNESNEISQNKIGSFNSKRKSMFDAKLQNISNKIGGFMNSKEVSLRNYMNNSEMIKSWSEHISNIMEMSLREEEVDVPSSDKRSKSNTDWAHNYYFTTRKRTSTPIFEESNNFLHLK